MTKTTPSWVWAGRAYYDKYLFWWLMPPWAKLSIEARNGFYGRYSADAGVDTVETLTFRCSCALTRRYGAAGGNGEWSARPCVFHWKVKGIVWDTGWSGGGNPRGHNTYDRTITFNRPVTLEMRSQVVHALADAPSGQDRDIRVDWHDPCTMHLRILCDSSD